jgi:hypothetical protein
MKLLQLELGNYFNDLPNRLALRAWHSTKDSF